MDNSPSREDWDALGVIVENVSWIVEDASSRPDPEGFGSGGLGLLGQSLASIESPSPVPRNRLAAFFETRKEWGIEAGLYAADGPLWMQGAPIAIDKVLPEAKSLSGKREERTKRLKEQLLPRLPAYVWLNRNRNLDAAVSTLEALARNGQAALLDDCELTLIKAVRQPIQSYLLFETSKDRLGFPANSDIDKAIRAATKLQEFFRQNSGVQLEMGLDLLRLPDALNKTVDHLASIKKRQDQKPQTLDGLRRYLIKSLCLALIEAFGVRSPTTIQHLLAIVDYEPEERHLRLKISEVLKETGR